GISGAINTAVLTQSYDVKSRFMDQINLQYYVTDDWHAYIGHRYLGGKNALALGSELGLPLGRGVMASAFVEGRIGSSHFEGVWREQCRRSRGRVGERTCATARLLGTARGLT